MKVDESNYELLERVIDATDVDYQIRWGDAENIVGYIELDEILGMLKDLLYELDVQKEKNEEMEKEYKELEDDMRENYRYIGGYEPDWHDIQDHKPSWWIDR